MCYTFDSLIVFVELSVQGFFVFLVCLLQLSESAKMAAVTDSTRAVALHWFRKGLRLHDNPALLDACRARQLFPVFCIDPYFAKPDTVGVNRYQFLLESLRDLDASLRARGSRLFVLKGKPEDVLLQAVEQWGVSVLVSNSLFLCLLISHFLLILFACRHLRKIQNRMQSYVINE